MTRADLKKLYGEELTSRQMLQDFRDGLIEELNITLLVLEYKV